MTSGWNATRKTVTALLLASVGSAMMPAPAMAQGDDARLRRIEAELRALQRVVFPGGDGRYFTPEVDTSQPQGPQQTVGTPSNSALTDVLARLDAIEAQLARLTARNEENANELNQLNAKVDEAIAAATVTGPALVAPSNSLAAAPAQSGARTTPAPTPTPASAATNRTPAPTPAAASTARTTLTPTPAPAGPPASRVAAVQAIAKPQTGDAGDDEYTYGFRLWEKGFYPEAQQQLALFLEKYPRHARVSFGRNLLGRAYLDNGQPREAATHFFENYQSNKQGDRAPDSLLYLSEAMVTLGDTNRACIALAEFSDTYPALATGRLKEQYDRARAKVRCTT